MRIRQDAWHLRLYRTAYIKDRASWLGVPEEVRFGWYGEWNRHCAEDPQLRLLRDFLDDFARKRDASYFAEWTRDDYLAGHEWYCEAEDRFNKAHIAWYKQKVAEYHAARAAELTDRLAGKRMSLCPYFWSVVIAVFYYTLILRTMNWFSRKIDKVLGLVARPIRITALTATVFAIAFSATAYRGAIWDVLTGTAKGFGEIAVVMGWEMPKAVVKGVANLPQRYLQHREERLAWERTHPQEVRWQRELKQRQAEQDRELMRELEAREAARTIADLKEIASTVAHWVAAAGVLAIVLIFVHFGRLADLVSALFVYLVFIKFGDETELGRRFFRWLDQWTQRQCRRWLAFARAMSDTWALFAAFAKATKERVCPFISIMDGERGYSSV